jgi:hypothetical protein
MRYIEHSSLRGKDASAAHKELGIVCERPVLPAACDLLRLRVQGHHTTAGESSDVRFPFSSSTRFQLTMLRAPVIEDAGEGA